MKQPVDNHIILDCGTDMETLEHQILLNGASGIQSEDSFRFFISQALSLISNKISKEDNLDKINSKIDTLLKDKYGDYWEVDKATNDRRDKILSAWVNFFRSLSAELDMYLFDKDGERTTKSVTYLSHNIQLGHVTVILFENDEDS